MIECTFREDGTMCTTFDYEDNPDKYRGLIDCLECGQKAWFIKGYTTDKINRMACFAAKHLEGCTASTVILSSDDEALGEEGSLPNNADIRVDLDKANNKSIYISQDNDKHGVKNSDWKSRQNPNQLGNANGFPLNKSLRQLLTNLCKKPDFAEKGQKIKILANSGRTVLDGVLKEHLVKIEDVKPDDSQKVKIFWGKINNLTEKENDVVSLNYGDERTEPSIIVDSGLKAALLKNFKLKDVSELDGSDVIVVGRVGFSDSDKAIIKASFTKYMSFRRIHVLDGVND